MEPAALGRAGGREGSVEDCPLVCLDHGWGYGPDGRLAEMKHDHFDEKLPLVKVRSYPARERYGVVWFYPGAPELAATSSVSSATSRCRVSSDGE